MKPIKICRMVFGSGSRARSFYVDAMMVLFAGAAVLAGVAVTGAHAGNQGVLQIQNLSDRAVTLHVSRSGHDCMDTPPIDMKIDVPANGSSVTFEFHRSHGSCDGGGGTFRMGTRMADGFFGDAGWDGSEQQEFIVDGDGQIVRFQPVDTGFFEGSELKGGYDGVGYFRYTWVITLYQDDGADSLFNLP